MKLFRPKQEYVFHTNLSVDESIEILKNTIDNDAFGLFSWASGYQMVGAIKGVKFRVFKGTGWRVDFWTPFEPVFYGALANSGAHTTITGHFSLHPFSKGLIFVLYAISILIVWPDGNFLSYWLLFLTAFIVLGIVLGWLHKRPILNFIEIMLEATAINSGSNE